MAPMAATKKTRVAGAALQRAERAQRLDTACLALVNIAKLRILLGEARLQA